MNQTFALSIVDNSEGEAESFIEYFYIATSPVNDAPVIESYNGPMDLDEDGSLNLTTDMFAVVDPDNTPIDFDLIMYSGENYETDSISVISPSHNFNGELIVNIGISDGDKSDEFSFPLMINPVNDPLHINTLYEEQVAIEGSLYTSSISWEDSDGTGDVGIYSV